MNPTREPLPISVCILCKNEADRLERCFAGLHAFSEIIVADTGSTDDSLEICRKHDVNLVEDEWVNFSVNRRQLFERASQPWILWLDADEIVNQALVDELYNLFATNLDPISGIQINRMVYFEGRWVKHGAWFPDWCMRIFRSDSWTMSETSVHEALEIDGSIVKLETCLEHYSFRDWTDLKQRSLFYESLWLKDKVDAHKKVSRSSAYTHAFFVFIKDYILKHGFLDGRLGLKIALHRSHEVWRKYHLLYQAGETK